MQRRNCPDPRGRIASYLSTNGRRNVRSGESASTLTAVGFFTVAVRPAHCVGGFVGGLVTPAGAGFVAPGALVESVRETFTVTGFSLAITRSVMSRFLSAATIRPGSFPTSKMNV